MIETPPLGPRQGKIWGTTQLLFERNDVECHAIRYKPKHFCSRHYHEHKFNRFVVMEGKLMVKTFMDEGTVDEIILSQGQITDVPPGVLHQFEGIEAGWALEFYWVVLCPQDIKRESQGGSK